MKLVDIKGNINPKQRLVLIITILLLLIVIFGILKSVTKKTEGIDYKNTNTDDLIIESTSNNDRDVYWNLNEIVYKFINTYQSKFTKEVKDVEYYYNALDPNYRKYLGKGKYLDKANNLITKVIGEEKDVFTLIPEPLITSVYKMDKYDNAYICQLSTQNESDNAYIGIILDTENKKFKQIRTEFQEGNMDSQNPWNTAQMKKWIECKPVDLEKYRLEKYFYLTRENLKSSSIDESGFSKNTKEILERIGRSKAGQMAAIIKDMKKLNAEEIADTFKIIIPKIEKGEMKFFVVRDLFLNFDAYKGKIVDAIGKSTVPIKAGDMAALRTMYNSDAGSMNTVLEIMVKKGTLTDEQITEIKEQRKS